MSYLCVHFTTRILDMSENTEMPQNNGITDAEQYSKHSKGWSSQKAPGMYIRYGYQKRLHHLVYEVIDNSIDRHLAGYCNKIITTIHRTILLQWWIMVKGIGMHEKLQESAREVVMTILTGGKV